MKNLSALRIRFAPPQTPIMTYMGMSISSQKMKKTKRSSARNDPSIAPSSRSSAKHQSLMRVWMGPNDAYAAMGVMTTVSRISHSEMPSTARW